VVTRRPKNPPALAARSVKTTPVGKEPEEEEGEEKSSQSSGFSRMVWRGEIPPPKWMNFYTKVLSKFATGKGLKLTLNVEVSPDDGVSAQKIEETKAALRELNLNDDLQAD